MKPPFSYFLFVYTSFILSGGCQKTIIPDTGGTGILKLNFRNMVNGSPMVLDSGNYTNPFGEAYNITKFKYYISHVRVTAPDATTTEKESYHLIDQGVPGSLSFSFESVENTFSNLHFLIGVDSIRNVSGAQTGALDPLNDMFWTWNSGYVMAKMEGTSPRSGQARNIIEYHIGGFAGINGVLKEITLNLPAGKPVVIKQGQTSEITVEADFNNWWQGAGEIKIADMPVCTTPGALAKKVADNYSKMFTVTEVVNN